MSKKFCQINQDAIVIWKPNNTILNRLRIRLGFSIDTSESVEISEWLKSSSPKKTNQVEREIEIKANEERICQMYQMLKQMSENAFD